MGYFDRNKYGNSFTKTKQEPVVTEMCDVCGRDWPAPIPRFRYITKDKVVFVIRHCPYCDPWLRLKKIGVENV